MMDYTIYYKNTLPVDDDWQEKWDIYISAYNSSDRVNEVFDKANAVKKYWVIQPDYGYAEKDYPTSGIKFVSGQRDEGEFIKEFLESLGEETIDKKICIDITGFIKPYMMTLFFLLKHKGIKKVDVLYSEPKKYVKKEETKFSNEFVREVRQVAGFMGCHETTTSNDILIIGAGYDDQLISQIAKDKDNCRKIQVYGLPSLRPDMYQENILNANQASEALGVHAGDSPSKKFSPANDPFVTAQTLSEIYHELNSEKAITNLYLSPLATKPQALGFTLFYLLECQGKNISMIYPYCDSHAKATADGVSRIWKYCVEFPA